MMNKAKLQRGEVVIDWEAIRSAMKVYSNLDKLGQHPLARLTMVNDRRKKAARSDTIRDYGWALQDLLHTELERLKPSGTEPENPGNDWYPYIVLNETYVRDNNIDYIADKLHVVSRTVKRRLEVSFQMMSDSLYKGEQEALIIQANRYELAAIPDKPKNYQIVGRDELISSLKAQLLTGEKEVLVSLQGGPGVGKTAIAVQLAHDLEIENYFQGGIIWMGLEEEAKQTKRSNTAEILMHLSRWGELLEISAESMARAAGIEERKRLLEQKIGSDRWLIVIDNVWDFALAKKLQLKSQNCAYLITTRNPNIGHRFADPHFIPVSELPVKEGQELIAQLAPKAQNTFPQKVEEIVQAVDGLPLSLILIGSYLRAESQSGQPRHLENAFEQLSLPENRLILSEQDVSIERPVGFPKDIPVSLIACIQFSVKMLDDRSRQALQSLSLLPPKPNTFTEEAAMAVSSLATPEPVDQLYNRGLLESFKGGRYAMHQTINDFARLRMKERADYTRVVDYYGRFIEDHKSDFLILDSETKNILVAIEIAHTHKKQSALVKGVNSLFEYLNTRAMYPTAKIHFERALRAAEVLNDKKGIVTTRLHLGQIAIRLGEYPYAKECFETGLKLAQRIKDRKSVCALLDSLGQLQKQVGEIDVAEKRLKEGLRIARQINDRFRIGSILASLGAIEFNRGNYNQSEVFLLEGLNIARELNNHDLSSSLLSNLGVMIERRGHLPEAREYYLESLSHARNTGNREQICRLHLYLGTVEQHLGYRTQSQENVSEAVRIAKQMGDPEKICLVYISVGALAGEIGDVDTAESYLQDALKLARDIKHPDKISYVLYNLGGVEIRRSNFALAKKYLTESLEIARKINLSLLIGLNLMSLGVTAKEQGHYTSAHKYLKAALSHAQKNNNRDTESDILIELANLYVATGKLDKARSVLEQAVDIAVETGSKDFEAEAYFRLSKIENMQGNRKKAIQLARKSLKLFVSIKFEEKAAEVRRYLKDELGVD